MTAISKSWVTIADAAVDPDSPLDAALMTGIRDDLVHMREWVGAGFFAGAIQDHNHDGVNSAVVPVGPNLLRNGSFESGESGWTLTDFSGGSHSISTANHRHGANALEITSTVLANGGGDALDNEFHHARESRYYSWRYVTDASVANVSSKLEAHWYDNTQALISTSVLNTYTNTPTAITEAWGAVQAPANARFVRLRVTGGIPATGSATGTVRFDGIFLIELPPIVQTMIDAAAVGQAQLKTTTASGSLNILTGAEGNYSLVGGTYSWWTASVDEAGAAGTIAIMWGNNDVAAGVIGLHNSSAATRNFYNDERYIQASPPYNLGAGDIPLFCWLMLDSLGNIISTQFAPDPPWAYHGPTIITPEFYVGDKPFRRYPQLNGMVLNQALKDKASMEAFMTGKLQIEYVDTEITHAIKNADMGLWPHPFTGNDLTGRSIVLLDPLSPLIDRFAQIHGQAGAREIRDIALGGYLTIDNKPMATPSPAGVDIVSATFKNTITPIK